MDMIGFIVEFVMYGEIDVELVGIVYGVWIYFIVGCLKIYVEGGCYFVFEEFCVVFDGQVLSLCFRNFIKV